MTPTDNERDDTVAQLIAARCALILSHRTTQLADSLRVARDAGIAAVEADLEAAEFGLREIREACPNCLIGASNVFSADLAWLAVETGARYVESPSLNLEIAAVCEASSVKICTSVSSLEGLEIVEGMRPDLLRFDLELLRDDRFSREVDRLALPQMVIIQPERAEDYLAMASSRRVAVVRMDEWREPGDALQRFVSRLQ